MKNLTAEFHDWSDAGSVKLYYVSFRYVSTFQLNNKINAFVRLLNYVSYMCWFHFRSLEIVKPRIRAWFTVSIWPEMILRRGNSFSGFVKLITSSLHLEAFNCILFSTDQF